MKGRVASNEGLNATVGCFKLLQHNTHTHTDVKTINIEKILKGMDQQNIRTKFQPTNYSKNDNIFDTP